MSPRCHAHAGELLEGLTASRSGSSDHGVDAEAHATPAQRAALQDWRAALKLHRQRRAQRRLQQLALLPERARRVGRQRVASQRSDAAVGVAAVLAGSGVPSDPQAGYTLLAANTSIEAWQAQRCATSDVRSRSEPTANVGSLPAPQNSTGPATHYQHCQPASWQQRRRLRAANGAATSNVKTLQDVLRPKPEQLDRRSYNLDWPYAMEGSCSAAGLAKVREIVSAEQRGCAGAERAQDAAWTQWQLDQQLAVRSC